MTTEAGPGAQRANRILIADDEAALLVAFARPLRARGHEVVLANSVAEAKACLAAQEFDVVLTDLHMPGENGIDLLRYVRAIDEELPVLLFTGAPTTESAVDAVQLRATGYLTKPIDPASLVAEVTRALKMRELADVRRRAHEMTRAQGAEAELERQLQLALDELYLVFQPIVRWSDRGVFGYEALMRTKVQALANPMALLEAAERFDRLTDLGRTVRRKAARMLHEHPDITLLVNLHPIDLIDDELFSPAAPLSLVASRVVLEITERAHLEAVADPEKRVAALRELGFRVAIDDIGAGYSGLNSFALLRPDFVKIDMALVRNIDQDAVKRRLTTLLVQLCADLSIGVVAEGVETAAERDTLIAIGCDFLQGYLFARPATPLPTPVFG